jgi:hypothetical protein
MPRLPGPFTANRKTCWLTVALVLCAGCRQQPPAAEKPPAAAVTAARDAAARGSSAPSDRLPQPAPVAQRTAEEILRQLVARCRAARSYQDQGVVRLAYRQGGQPVRQEWPCSVVWQRPNQLLVRAFQATVWCDGESLAAHIRDETTGDLDGQVLLRPAPAELQASDLTVDPLLDDILRGRVGRLPAMVELLLPSHGLLAALEEDVACRRLDDDTYDGRMCFRVEVASVQGPLVLWIDQQEGYLRRLDYSARHLLPELAADPSVSEIALFADLQQAQFDRPIAASTFQQPLPAGAKKVQRFVMPPPPLPSALVGQRPSPFFFTTLEGQKLAQDDLTGAIAILVWYHDHPACQATLQEVAQARQRLADKPKVHVYAVATDPASVPEAALRQRLAQWQVDLPILRDLEAFGDSVFQIQVQPTLVVLDRQGRVQALQAGGNPEMAEQLVTLVERLEAGQDVAAEVLTAAQEARRQYEQLLARGGVDATDLRMPQPVETIIRKASEPRLLRRKKLWRSQALRSPGNVLLVPEGDGSRLYVLEGWRQVAELDASGNLAARYPLDLPPQLGVTFLRSVQDRKGQLYFLAGAPFAPQLFVFDRDWRLQLAYPPPGHAPLAVVDLAGIDRPSSADDPGSSLTIYIANVADVGLAAISLEGQTRWRNRTFPNALSVALCREASSDALAIFVPGQDGTVLKVHPDGTHDPPVKVGNWPILRLVAGQFRSPRGAVLLGITHDEQFRPFAVGLTHELKEVWNYPLRAGTHAQPIEPICASDLWADAPGQWWLAGPDGSIHVISADGKWFDSFHYGSVLSGLAVGIVAGQPALVVATPDDVTAWQIDRGVEPVQQGN